MNWLNVKVAVWRTATDKIEARNESMIASLLGIKQVLVSVRKSSSSGSNSKSFTNLITSIKLHSNVCILYACF